MTPGRTIAVAVLTFVAVVASPFAAAVITGLLVEGCPCPSAGGDSSFAHAFGHLLWAVLTLAVALGIRRLRRDWPAPGLTGRDPTLRLQSSPRGSTAPAPNLLLPVRAFGEKQYQLLAFAQRLAVTTAAGQFLASAGANFIDVRSLNAPPHEGYFAIVHAAGEIFSLVSFVILLFVCVYMLGVGVRGSPATDSSSQLRRDQEGCEGDVANHTRGRALDPATLDRSPVTDRRTFYSGQRV